MNPSDPTEDFDVVIIGAGWYGLIAAWTYLRLAPATQLLVVDDADSIGGVWSKERIYPNLFAQVGHGLFEYTFYPMRNEGLTPDRYISGETISKYLYNFAHDHDVAKHVRLQTRITKVEKLDSGQWHLTSPSLSRPLRCDKLIVASGVTSQPHIVHFPNQGFQGKIMHSADLGLQLGYLHNPTVKRVLVLGAAKSSYDAVFLLLKAGKRVEWIIREDGSGPLAIMPPRLFGFLNTVDVMARRACAAFSSAILNAHGVWYHILQKTKLGRLCVRGFWRVVNKCAEVHAGYARTENARKLRPLPHGEGIMWANAGLGLASVPDFWKTFHAGNITVHRTNISAFGEDDQVHLKNGTAVGVDAAILCTGWTHNMSAFDEKLRGQYGLPSSHGLDLDLDWKRLDAKADEVVDRVLPYLKNGPQTETEHSEKRSWRLYKRLVSPVASAKNDCSIFFPGQIHSVFTPLVAEFQALWGVEYLRGNVKLPSLESMKAEVSVWNAWTRKRYLEQGRRHAYSIYDYLAYCDDLARDLGIRTQRKKNAVLEMFQPYRPSDYRGLIEEYLAANPAAGYQER
ncbi:MAG: hypothetical protein Q9228_003057 [Teloschistes exilis]